MSQGRLGRLLALFALAACAWAAQGGIAHAQAGCLRTILSGGHVPNIPLPALVPSLPGTAADHLHQVRLSAARCAMPCMLRTSAISDVLVALAVAAGLVALPGATRRREFVSSNPKCRSATPRPSRRACSARPRPPVAPPSGRRPAHRRSAWREPKTCRHPIPDRSFRDRECARLVRQRTTWSVVRGQRQDPDCL